MNRQQTVAFHTLGCKLNYSETSSLKRVLENEGFVTTAFDTVADIYVINTCSVTENADKECRQIVRKLRRQAAEAVVVITGCYAQLKPEQIAQMPGVDLVLGAGEKFNLPKHIKNFTRGDSAKICSCDIDHVTDFHSAYSSDDRTRTFLKVQDGCSYNCSFCTIPLARGKSRSDSMEQVLRNVEEIAAKGTKEIVLTGINLGDFQSNNEAGQARNFYQLLQALEELNGVPRYRISSIEPNLLTEQIIELVSQSDKILPHFHIPLQSGSNKILGLMRRRYKRELYAERVNMIKARMPHCSIGVDVITGFPAETDEDFRETYNFLHELDVSYFHVFTYSERANTHALSIKPVVPIAERQQRNKALRQLSYQKLNHFTEQHVGTIRPVLWEPSKMPGMMEGYTDNYIKVEAAAREGWVNTIRDWNV